MAGTTIGSMAPRLLMLIAAACVAAATAAVLLSRTLVLAPAAIVVLWLAVLVLLLATIWLVLGRLLRPLRQITRAASSLADGDLHVALPAGATGELGALARQLGRVREELERQSVSLRESEARYRKLFDAVSEGLLLLDQDGVVVAANARLRETHGWSPPQLAGRPMDLLLRKQDRELAQSLRTPPADRPLVVGGVSRDRDGRERATEFSALRLVLQGRPHALVLLRDMTELRRLERQLALTQKFETVGHLAGGIAHDFNNLLTPILGYSEMLLADPDLDETARADLLAIQRAGERARDLARRLLDYSRQQAPAMQRCDLGRTIREAEPLLRQTLRENVDLHLELDPAPHPVLADPGQIEQVLMNLAINAMEAMPDGGRLTIGVESARRFAETGETSANETAPDCCRLRVRDGGPGIAADIIDRVCEPLFTTKRSGRGTGLGLTTVQSIVKQHHGTMTIRNHPTGGCEVAITLPRADALAATEAAADAPATDLPHGRGETIVLVEDDAMVRRLIEVLLAKYGYAVRSYAGGADCLADLAERPAPADLLLTDVVMPGMDGPRLRDELLTAGWTLPTLYISGYTAETLLRRGLAAGPGDDLLADFLQKPLTPEMLLGKLRRMLAAPAEGVP
jgi:two-component system, cell cycle sensor histidine kinase and response regulator CckA